MYCFLFFILLIPFIYFNQNYIKQIYTLSNVSKGKKVVNKMQIISTMFGIMFSFLKVYIFQKLNKNVKCIGLNKYELRFIINNKLIKIQVICNNDNPILQIIDDNDNDITQQIEPYFQDLTIITKYKPNDFNYHKLTFETIDGDEKTFDSHDLIQID